MREMMDRLFTPILILLMNLPDNGFAMEERIQRARQSQSPYQGSSNKKTREDLAVEQLMSAGPAHPYVNERLDLEALRNMLSRMEPVPVPTCKAKLQPKLTGWESRQLQKGYKPSLADAGIKASDVVGRSDIEIDFNAKPKNVRDVLEGVGTTEVGAQKLREALQKIKEGKLKIRLVTKAEIEKRRKQTSGAVYDPDLEEILINSDRELGILIPTLLHELTHAVDPEFRQRASKCKMLYNEFVPKRHAILASTSRRLGKNPKDVSESDLTDSEKRSLLAITKPVDSCYNILTFYSERWAFQAQHQIIAELKELSGCYNKYIEFQGGAGRIITEVQSPTLRIVYNTFYSDTAGSPW